MDKQEWEHTTHSLRKLLHAFNEEDDFSRKVEYCFGLQYNSDFDWYHLWDALIKNTIAIIRLDTDRAIMRYSPETNLVHELHKFQVDDLKSIFIPSTNITRYDGWVHSQLQERCTRAVREHRDFLERQQTRSHPPYSITFSFPRISYNGQPTATSAAAEMIVQTVSVTFSSEDDMQLYRREAEHMLRGLVESGVIPADGYTISFRDLIEAWRQSNLQSISPRDALERYLEVSRRSTYGDRQSYMGRPISQLQDYIESNVYTEGYELTEETLMQAVQALDNANIVAEEAPRTRTRNNMWELYNTIMEPQEGDVDV